VPPGLRFCYCFSSQGPRNSFSIHIFISILSVSSFLAGRGQMRQVAAQSIRKLTRSSNEAHMCGVWRCNFLAGMANDGDFMIVRTFLKKRELLRLCRIEIDPSLLVNLSVHFKDISTIPPLPALCASGHNNPRYDWVANQIALSLLGT